MMPFLFWSARTGDEMRACLIVIRDFTLPFKIDQKIYIWSFQKCPIKRLSIRTKSEKRRLNMWQKPKIVCFLKLVGVWSPRNATVLCNTIARHFSSMMSQGSQSSWRVCTFLIWRVRPHYLKWLRSAHTDDAFFCSLWVREEIIQSF